MMWTCPSLDSAADSSAVWACPAPASTAAASTALRSGGAVGGSFLGAMRVPVGGDLLGAVAVPVGRLGLMGVDVRAGGEHRPHGEHAEDDGGDDQATLLAAFGREDRSRVGGEDGDGGEQGAGGVGELRRLAYLEAVDPREAGETRVEPSGDRGRR